jgi:hypothetical protein
MVVYIAPSEQKHNNKDCVVCHRPLVFYQASLGARYTDGRQAFACDYHLAQQSRRAQWIVAWVDFIAEEKSCNPPGVRP